MPISSGKKLLLEIAGVILAGIILVTGLLVWRLSHGPFNADFLKPMAEATLSAKSGLDVHIGAIVLEWNGAHTPFDVDLSHITGDGAAGEIRRAAIDKIELHLSAFSLLKGAIHPISLTVTHPQLWLVAEKQTDTKSSSFDLSSILTPDKRSDFVLWHDVAITEGDIDFHDAQDKDIGTIHGLEFHSTRTAQNVVAEASAKTLINGEAATFKANAGYDPQADLLSVVVTVDKLQLDSLATLSPALAKLATAQIPVSVQLNVQSNAHLTIKSAHLKTQISSGQIIDSNLFDMPASVSGGHIEVDYQAEPERIVLQDFTINLGDATVMTTGIVSTENGIAAFDTTTSFAAIPIDSLQTYWPKTVSHGGRHWVLENLSKGTITQGQAHFAGTAPRDHLDDLNFTTVEGGFRVDDALVHYFGKLPSIEGVNGDVKFDAKTMTVSLSKGHVSDINLDSGTVVINGLSANDQDIVIDVATSGSIPTYLDLINRDPLYYAKKLKIEPGSATGSATVKLHMAFPLLDDVSSAQMQILANANLHDVDLPGIANGKAIDNLNGMLNVTGDTMEFKGSGAYQSIALNADWTQNFNHQNGVDSDAMIDGVLTDKDRKAVGLDFPDRLTGPIKVTAHYIDKGETQSADVSADFTKADFKIGEIDYEKKPQIAGSASATLSLNKNGLSRIDNINIQSDKLSVIGAVDLDPVSEDLRHLELSRFQAGDTNITATVDMVDGGGSKIELNGSRFDIGPLLHKKRANEAEKDPADTTPLVIDFDLGRIETSPTSGLDNAKGHLSLAGKRWLEAIMSASAEGTPFTFSYKPQSEAADAPRVLAIDAPDAGKAFAALSLTNSMRGGVLHVEGGQGLTTDGNPVDQQNAPVTGHAEISNFTLVNTPFLGRLLNLLSLTGLMETFSGKGMAFNSIAIDFQLNQDKVVLQDGRIDGPSIGMTLQGTENRDDGMLDLSGTVVPANSANQMLNAIPLLGPLLTGGEGQGVFAATYRITGSFDDPKVSINPLSIFAPGVLRDLFFERKAPADLPGSE